MERVKLDDAAIAAHRAKEPEWDVLDGKLTRTFEFPSYAAGVLFAVGVANVAERMDHHPDLTIGYRRVKVAVSTHDVGGISPFDFELARRVDGLV